MKQDEIIEMARQAGAAVGKPTPDGPNIVFTQCLDVYAFAKLVAAKEREACGKVCDDFAEDQRSLYKGRPPYTGKELGRASDYVQGNSDGADICASAIRARGQT